MMCVLMTVLCIETIQSLLDNSLVLSAKGATIIQWQSEKIIYIYAPWN